MKRRFLAFCLPLACGAMLAGEAAAQQHFPVSMEASFGPTMTHSRMYSTATGAAVDVVLGYRLRDTSVGTLIGALNAGVQLPAGSKGCVAYPGGDCSLPFPAAISGGPLLGIQRGSPRTASARILAGPTYYHALEEGRALGLQGRVDVSTPAWMHTAVVASVRHSVLPSFRNDAVGITSFGLGLRVQ